MAERAQASTMSKPLTRAQRILALVPKPGAGSDNDNSASSGDELNYYHDQDNYNSDSSIPATLPPALEDVRISSESENEFEEFISTALSRPNTTHTFQSPRTKSPSVFDASDSPSLLQGTNFSIRPVLIPSSSLHNFDTSSLNTSVIEIPSPLSSHASVSSPSTATRSKRGPLTVAIKTVVKIKKLEVKWTRKPFEGKADIQGKQFDKSSDRRSPLEYFKLFFSDDLFDLIVHESNLYHMQVKGTPLNLTIDDIKDFIAINIMMGVVSMPAYTDYWSKALRYDKVADTMTLKQFQKIRRFIHFSDNLRDNGDRYYKIRPLLEIIRQNCLKIEEEKKFSIDEMMVPYKGTRAGTRRQYIKNKPRKWGFKIFVRAGTSGIVYDFLVYGGEDTFRYHQFSHEESGMGLGAKVVLALSKTIKEPACSVIFFDNFFTSLELIYRLRNEYGIFALGTIRQNRLRGADKKLPNDKILKKKGRGAHAQIVSNEKKIAIVKWFDNKCVTVASSYVDSQPIHQVLRYNKIKKSREPVSCPNIIRQYNENMGGVDLADMLVALYRTEMRAHRWYIPLFSQMLDICVNNAWLLYRRQNTDAKPIKLKEFRCAISRSIVTEQRMWKENASGLSKFATPTYRCDSRYDHVGHLPSFTTKGRCKNCIKGQTKYLCVKCNVRLCLVEERNCFYNYHTQV